MKKGNSLPQLQRASVHEGHETLALTALVTASATSAGRDTHLVRGARSLQPTHAIRRSPLRPLDLLIVDD